MANIKNGDQTKSWQGEDWNSHMCLKEHKMENSLADFLKLNTHLPYEQVTPFLGT